MKLSSDSKIIKWAYFQEQDYMIPEQTNVCFLFWRSFFLTPLKAILIAFMFVVFSPMIGWCWLKKKGYLDFLDMQIPLRFPSVPKKELLSLGWQRAKDWKSGVCTIVEIERKPEA